MTDPAPIASVCVGPPLSARSPSTGSVFTRSPFPGLKPQVSALSTLPPPSVATEPSQLSGELPATTLFDVVVSSARASPPPPAWEMAPSVAVAETVLPARVTFVMVRGPSAKMPPPLAEAKFSDPLAEAVAELSVMVSLIRVVDPPSRKKPPPWAVFEPSEPSTTELPVTRESVTVSVAPSLVMALWPFSPPEPVISSRLRVTDGDPAEPPSKVDPALSLPLRTVVPAVEPSTVTEVSDDPPTVNRLLV